MRIDQTGQDRPFAQVKHIPFKRARLPGLYGLDTILLHQNSMIDKYSPVSSDDPFGFDNFHADLLRSFGRLRLVSNRTKMSEKKLLPG